MKAKILALSVALLTGCANTGPAYRPLVDARPGQNYEHDLAQCQAYAHQVAGAAESAAAGVVIGAIFGAVVSGLLGGSRQTRNDNMMIGAISGGTGAGVQGETDQRNVIRRCLSGRGYSVLQ